MKLPNGPQTPGIIQMLQWIVSPMSFMESCAKRYGDIFTLQLNRPVVFVSDPSALQQILSSDTKEFEAPSDWNTTFEPMLGKHSVITLSGEAHRRQRQLLLPPLHGDRMRTYGNVIGDITQQIINQWQLGKPFDVRSGMQAITLRVIMQAVFGLYEGSRAQELEKLLVAMLENRSPLQVVILYFPALQRDLGPLTSWGTFLRRREQVNQLLYAQIQQYREHPDPSRTDILSLLMTATDEAGQSMTDVELRDELITLLTAGHETTATALTWALYWIHKLPEVRQKLLEELDSLGDNPDPNTLFKLPYLNAVCCEALRIYPVGMLTFPRVVKTPVSLCGCELEPGTVLLGSIYLTHQREDLYPQPKQFKPERFLERQFSAYEFLPFGGGARRCIGMAFAQYEMKVVLAKILLQLELALVDNRDVHPKRRGLVTAPAHPIQMVVKGQRSRKSKTLASISG
ncbi:cytochrome P450 [Aetokthonos hydrillicola Thurmond2011]|jgi:cytochrome P450|uniref:Cytochrome P450 n=1 Tax=Aetokthonos hydrillicola Thurmond2011 TaxID=2712845 RepID=A0AAP5MBN7_9CYAN|nr:cytochrome P450 [Aetokthonos hydrillicola]MBO3461446.1 cytochrome P450 [Aetokthonos hydrillicola CCALA 1050]MBW4588788.1 cytochrome P450 [Aetokthonos hydrillicola CCALA 1050]MDR9897348.1 cytochrome P450 [Aetokthonos hydrillicola Thurmond2011]